MHASFTEALSYARSAGQPTLPTLFMVTKTTDSPDIDLERRALSTQRTGIAMILAKAQESGERDDKGLREN